MGLLDNWATATDTAELKEGQPCRVTLSYSAVPGFRPTSDEMQTAIEFCALFSVSNIEEPGYMILLPGATQWVVTGTPTVDLTASDLRGGFNLALEYAAREYASLGLSGERVESIETLPPGSQTTGKGTAGDALDWVKTTLGELPGTLSTASFAVIAVVIFLMYREMKK
jgi:hypothetical protein